MCSKQKFRKKVTSYKMYFSFARFIMVPYYPWKLSHRHHHKNTGNIDKDEIFYPVRENRDMNNGHRRRLDSCLTLSCSRTAPRPAALRSDPLSLRYTLGCHGKNQTFCTSIFIINMIKRYNL